MSRRAGNCARRDGSFACNLTRPVGWVVASENKRVGGATGNKRGQNR